MRVVSVLFLQSTSTRLVWGVAVVVGGGGDGVNRCVGRGSALDARLSCGVIASPTASTAALWRRTVNH